MLEILFNTVNLARVMSHACEIASSALCFTCVSVIPPSCLFKSCPPGTSAVIPDFLLLTFASLNDWFSWTSWFRLCPHPSAWWAWSPGSWSSRGRAPVMIHHGPVKQRRIRVKTTQACPSRDLPDGFWGVARARARARSASWRNGWTAGRCLSSILEGVVLPERRVQNCTSTDGLRCLLTDWFSFEIIEE